MVFELHRGLMSVEAGDYEVARQAEVKEEGVDVD